MIKKITQETKLKTAILIMQKEAGLRFVGLPNEKSSLISNILQINYDLNFLTKISRNEFTPKPKVDACIISIKRKDKNEDTDERWFKDFLTVVFTKAKPLLKDALKSVFTKVQINNICTKNKIKPNTHIRSITFTQWVSLFNVFETHSDKSMKLKTKGAYKKLLKEQSKLEKSHRTRKLKSKNPKNNTGEISSDDSYKSHFCTPNIGFVVQLIRGGWKRGTLLYL